MYKFWFVRHHVCFQVFKNLLCPAKIRQRKFWSNVHSRVFFTILFYLFCSPFKPKKCPQNTTKICVFTHVMISSCPVVWHGGDLLLFNMGYTWEIIIILCLLVNFWKSRRLVGSVDVKCKENFGKALLAAYVDGSVGFRFDRR